MNEDGVDCNMLIFNKDKRTQVQTFCEIIHDLKELQDVLAHAQTFLSLLKISCMPPARDPVHEVSTIQWPFHHVLAILGTPGK